LKKRVGKGRLKKKALTKGIKSRGILKTHLKKKAEETGAIKDREEWKHRPLACGPKEGEGWQVIGTEKMWSTREEDKKRAG